jgi:hypothetical protein
MASELDDLRSFLEQRLRDADPGLDVTAGSLMDVKVITPLIERLAPDPFDTPIQDFARNRLRSQYPELVLQKGEPIDDLVIKPFRILMEPFRRVVTGITRNQSIANPTILNDREADSLAANFFAKRKLGGFSIGQGRLYFSSARFAQVTPINALFSSDGLRFFPVETQQISADRMLFQTEGSLFYFDVICRSEAQGKKYNIDRNKLVGIEGFPAVVKVTNVSKFESGDDAEDIVKFLTRVEKSLTEKSLVVSRGIKARLTQVFDSVKSVSVIGFGDPEMERDIITGSPEFSYAVGLLTARTSSSSIFLGAIAGSAVSDGVVGHSDFEEIGVAVGDIANYFDLVTGAMKSFTVTEIVSPFQVRVTPAPPDLLTLGTFTFNNRSRGSIYLSDIPGGILQPMTSTGEIKLPKNQIHIGGALDAFIRAGSPVDRSIDISAVTDGEPLHFGLDLESFGAEANELVQVTPKIVGAATTTASFVGPGDITAQILIKSYNAGDGTVPWKPTAQDVGRYIQLLGSGGTGSGTDFGIYQIQAILGDELVSGTQAVRIRVSLTDWNTNTNTVGISDHSGTFDLDFRIVDVISPKSRVRDRSYPQVDFNGNSNGLGSQVGDSIVIETGADAGIYSIRRILSSIGEDDTLVLDRNLTATVTPTGAGDYSGLRYKLADELQVDLVEPKVVKIPIGDIFPGGDLEVVAGSPTVFSGGSSNFLLAGVEVGDTLEITEGDNAGKYEITSVAADNLDVAPQPISTAFNLEYIIYRSFTGIQRPLVRVTAVELLDSTNQRTGITVPYGGCIDARVLGKFSNRADGIDIESFNGEVVAGGPPLLAFRDTTTDFVAKGIRAGFKMEIYAGDNHGEYEVASVVDANNLTVIPSTSGGKDFVTAGTLIHYAVGEASVGFVRLYFLEPTSAEIDTGLSGGRLEYRNEDIIKGFRYSSTQGRRLIPAASVVDQDLPRDLRVVRSYSAGPAFETILEITDPANADAFDAEINVGDVFDINEPIPFKNSGGSTLFSLGIFGTPSGLHTLTGSNKVSVPEGSRIDFTQMGVLVGQLLYINSGVDAGQYRISRVVNDKILELDGVMTTTTAELKGQELATSWDAFLVEDPPASGNVYLRDDTDYTLLGDVGEYITIFEAKSAAIEGTYQISVKDSTNHRVKLTGLSAANVPLGPAGSFSWIRTPTNTNIHQPFSIYTYVPKAVQVTQAATKAPEVKPLGTANITGLNTLTGTGQFSGVVKGDRLEIMYGVSRGIYPILSATANAVTTYSAHPFLAVEAGVKYRIWAGLHGPRRFITVGTFEGSDGKIQLGSLIPYSVRRPDQVRSSSTEMQNNVEGGLYYMDMQVESMGPGDDRNLEQGVKVEPVSGMRVDGYTYRVENNTLSFSPFEKVALVFDRRFLPVGNTDLPENMTEVNGRNLQVRYETSPTVNLIHNLLRSDSDRPNNANPIGRHFLPSFVYTTLSYTGGSSTQVTGPDVEDYINNLDPLTPLEVGNIEKLISRRGATSIKHPILLTSVTHDLDRRLVVERSEDKIGGSKVPYNGSARISSFFATFGDGLIVERT